MNKHILVAMDWKNRSREELEKNLDAAYEIAVAARAARVAARAARAAADADDDYVEYWLYRYFEITGEDRKEYEKTLKEIDNANRGR